MPQPSALQDLTVLDLSHALAGPFASTMLGDFGANIIKIEPPGAGDMSRHWGPPFYDTESAYFVNLNRNKRSVVLDLKQQRGRDLFLALARDADIVLENMRVGTVEKLGLGYAQVSAVNPAVVYCSISGFGQNGPYRDRTALDLIVQAESGMISVTGPVGGPGVRCGVSVADTAAGMFAAFGILTAVHARRHTGRGQFIDVSMFEGQLSLLQGVIGAYLADHIVPGPLGTAYAALLPYQTFRTTTQDIAIAIGNDRLWHTFCPLMELDHLAHDPRYATNPARVVNRTSLIATLQQRFAAKSYEDWESILLPAGIPVGAINAIDKVVAHPQVVARDALPACPHPAAPDLHVFGPAIRLSDTPGRVRTAAPYLGEHTDAVLRERLGLSDAELCELRSSRIIGSSHAPNGRRPATI